MSSLTRIACTVGESFALMTVRAAVFNLWSADPRGSAEHLQGVRKMIRKYKILISTQDPGLWLRVIDLCVLVNSGVATICVPFPELMILPVYGRHIVRKTGNGCRTDMCQ